jgi:hypothetical protein
LTRSIHARHLAQLDVCRKLGDSGNTYSLWRLLHEPAEVDDAPGERELQIEVERLKLLVVELMLYKQML